MAPPSLVVMLQRLKPEATTWSSVRSGSRSPASLGRRLEAVLLQPGEDEVVDGVADPAERLDGRGRGPLRRDERPVRLVLGALGDPALERLLLGLGQLLLRLARRHPLAGLV